jgi:hypothetical protein
MSPALQYWALVDPQTTSTAGTGRDFNSVLSSWFLPCTVRFIAYNKSPDNNNNNSSWQALAAPYLFEYTHTKGWYLLGAPTSTTMPLISPGPKRSAKPCSNTMSPVTLDRACTQRTPRQIEGGREGGGGGGGIETGICREVDGKQLQDKHKR